MGFGLYKPGQGYWVRVMTAAMIAVITFATAGWLMGQMAVLADKLPVHSWAADLGNVTGQVEVGQHVKLLTPATASAPAEPLGTAEIQTFDSSSQTVRIHAFVPIKPGYEPTAAGSFAPGDDGKGFTAPLKGSVRKIAAVQPVYLQGGGAALVLLVGAVLAFYFAGAKKNSVEFLISTDMEMKKVNWSTQKDIRNSTLVVVGAAVMLAAVLFGIDVAFQQFFRVIKILQ
jgi:preprotein translocase SecE subunit